MERRKVVKFLKDLETDFRGTERDQFINVNDLITDLNRFLRVHGDNLFIRVTDYESEWSIADIELIEIRDETHEEFTERVKQKEFGEKQNREARRRQYEELRKEFEGDGGIR